MNEAIVATILHELENLRHKRETQLTKESPDTYNYGYVAGEIGGISKAIRTIQSMNVPENWREIWSRRQKAYRHDKKIKAMSWAENHQHEYEQPLKVEWHPKDEWVVFWQLPEEVSNNEISHFNWVVHTPKYDTWEFVTCNDIWIDESDMETDLFRLFIWKDGRVEVMVANTQDYDIHEDASYLFDLDAIEAAAKASTPDIDDATQEYINHYKVYVFKGRDGELFGVTDRDFDLELASVDELNRDLEWGDYVQVKEGLFYWDDQTKDYVRQEAGEDI
jgi:hypothetical protein